MSSEPDYQGVSVASTPLQDADKGTPGRPMPIFLPEPNAFSTKKERGSLLQRPRPPKPQAKTCPPISRVFKRRSELHTTQSVTFIHPGDDNSVLGTPLLPSAVYDSAKKASYFEQAFAVEAKIGAGCFGDVYRVRSNEDGQLYAVKIARDFYRGRSDRAKKLEEVRKHQFLLPHSNCVHFYQSWEEKGRLYQQFELCEGSLMELSEREHDISEATIWSYLVDLLLALEHLHDHGLIHMDIKPENIFIGREGVCKLGDFGIVIDLAKDDTNYAAEGDPKYLAPEILDSRTFSKAADVFSLGVTILELSCDLDLPKQGDLWHRLRTEGPDPSLTAHLSPDLRRVIQLMMTNYIDRRPTVKQLLALPAVQKGRKARERQLALGAFAAYLKASFSPMWAMAVFALTIFFWIPLKAFKVVAQRIFPPDTRTPPPDGGGGGGRMHQVNFYVFEDLSSNYSDLRPFDRSSSSALASPLKLQFSEDDDDGGAAAGVGDELDGSSSKSSGVEMTPRLTRSTPGNASRFRSRFAESNSPTFSSPKRRLNFESFANESPRAVEKTSASPKLGQRSTGGKKVGTPVCKPRRGQEPSNGLTTPKSRSRRTKVHFHRSTGSSKKLIRFDPMKNDDDDVQAVRPISLVTKFDAFSDTDNDDA